MDCNGGAIHNMCHCDCISSVFGHPYSWGALLREGSASLNGLSPLLNHWNGHLNCKIHLWSSIVTLEFLLVCALPCGHLDCDEDWCKPFLAGL